MRMGMVIVVSALLGLALGIGTSWARLGRAPDFSADYDVLGPATTQTETLEPAKGLKPRAKVDAEDYDFGTVEREHYATHTFRVTNSGEGPLVLKTGGTTCMKCTISKIPKEPILPGESAGVEVQYHASIDAPQFRQSATILTNDPLAPRLVFTVSGKISASYSVRPPELVFSRSGRNRHHDGQNPDHFVSHRHVQPQIFDLVPTATRPRCSTCKSFPFRRPN